MSHLTVITSYSFWLENLWGDRPWRHVFSMHGARSWRSVSKICEVKVVTSTTVDWVVQRHLSKCDIRTLPFVKQCLSRFLGIIAQNPSFWVQLVTCCDLSVFLYSCEACSIDSSKMIGNWLFLKLNRFIFWFSPIIGLNGCFAFLPFWARKCGWWAYTVRATTEVWYWALDFTWRGGACNRCHYPYAVLVMVQHFKAETPSSVELQQDRCPSQQEL